MKAHTALLALLSPLFLVAVAPAQTWVNQLAFYEDGGASSPVAVSDAGKIAVIRHTTSLPGFTILSPDGVALSEFGITELGGRDTELYDVLFLDESTIAVCGSVGQDAYMAAFDTATGLPVWEEALEIKSGSDGKMTRMTRNGLGHIVATGSMSANLKWKTFACSITPAGGILWFREYTPGPGNHGVGDIAADANGDLFLTVVHDGILEVMKLTSYGHQIWTTQCTLPSGAFSGTTRTQVASDGALLVACSIYDGSTKYAALRLDGPTTVDWANVYDFPVLQGAYHGIEDTEVTPDGGLLIGLGLVQIPVPYLSAGVLRLRPDGTPLWVRSFGGATTSSRAPSLELTADGGFVASAEEPSFGARVFRASAGGDVGICAGTYSIVNTSALQVNTTASNYNYTAFPGFIAPNPVSLPTLFSATNTNLCGQSCSPAAVYCVAKPNSQGCTPEIDSTGTASLSGPGITVTADQVLSQKNGLLFWGTAASGTAFQGGIKCVAGPVKRTPAQTAGGSAGATDCTGSYAFTFDAAYMNAKGIGVGDTVYTQYWSRDPGAPFTTGLTDGLQFTVCP